MTTSDSEDFESADEDFEFEQSKEKLTPKKSSSSSNQDKLDINLKSVDLSERESKNEGTCNALEKNVPVKEVGVTEEKEILKSALDKNLADKNVKTEMSEKRQSEVLSSSKSRRPQQVRTKSETNSGPKKLGTRITVTNKDNKNLAETVVIKCDIPTKPQKHEPVIDNREFDEVNDFEPCTVKKITKPYNLPTVQQTDNIKEDGDGWEVETEDGFEIPTSLHEKPKKENTKDSSKQDVFCALDRLSQTGEKTENKGWGGWGSFGMSSLLSTATESVSVLSSHVTAGLTSVSSVLDTGLGAPDPEQLARKIHQEETEEPKKKEPETKEGTSDGGGSEQHSFPGFGSIVSGVSLIGSKVITGGLDTLETLGKKTMEVLQDGDPRLMKKRAMFFQEDDKPVLSQILREAKEKAENSDKEQKEKEEGRQANFEALFDDFQGMVHLEALEMLSKQCQLKLQSILLANTGEALVDLQETLSEVKQLCELPEESDDEEVLTDVEFADKISECIKGLHKSLTGSKLIQMNNDISNRLNNIQQDEIVAKEVNKLTISTLAEFTALAMEIFHKGAELLLTKPHHSTADEAESLTLLTCMLCARVSTIANMFTELLTKEDPIANSASITNIYKESANSGSYIQSACQLLLPVIQVGATS